jgi:hypothetical protein
MMEEAKENDPQECGPAKAGVKRRAAFNAPAFKKPAMAAANAGKPALARSTTATARPAAAAPPAAAAAASSEVRYFTVLYCKYQPSKKQRKNKSFADGILSIGLDSKRAVRAALMMVLSAERLSSLASYRTTTIRWFRLLYLLNTRRCLTYPRSCPYTPAAGLARH